MNKRYCSFGLFLSSNEEKELIFIEQSEIDHGMEKQKRQEQFWPEMQ